MFDLSARQRRTALIWLSLFHVLIITSSNYLVQLPITIFGFHTTWGAFTFPFIFLATDLTVRIYGAPLARRIITSVMIPALAISYVVSALFFQGEWAGFEALSHFNLFVARIAAASFMAYALGQIWRTRASCAQHTIKRGNQPEHHAPSRNVRRARRLLFSRLTPALRMPQATLFRPTLRAARPPMTLP